MTGAAIANWQALPTATRSDLRMLAAELGRRIGIPASRTRLRDTQPARDHDGNWAPVSHLAPEYSSRPPSKIGTVNTQSQALRDRTAPRFQWVRRAGRTILSHRTIQPVGTRRGSSLLDYISRATWQNRAPEPPKPQS